MALPDRAKGPTEVDRAIADLDDDRVKQGLLEIKQEDPKFDLGQFLSGARAAFEMIVEAYAGGNKNVLRPLLDDDVFEGFSRAIDQREAEGQILETQLIGVRSNDVAEAALVGNRARVTVRFVSEQVNVLRGPDGTALDGEPGEAEEVVDLWTFERDVRSSDPNWLLVETRTP